MFFEIKPNYETGEPRVSESGGRSGFFCVVLADGNNFARIYGKSAAEVLVTSNRVVELLNKHQL